MRRRSWIMTPIAMLSMTLAVSAAAAEGDPAAGKRLAVKVCARCHLVSKDDPYGGIDSTPSFFTMARKPASYDVRLRAFRERPPHPPQKLGVKDGDIDDLLAYIRSLKDD